MNKLHFHINRQTGLVLLISILLFAGCSNSMGKKSKTLNAIMEDHETEVYNFPEGFYYAYQFPEDAQSGTFDEKSLITQVLDTKLPVRNIWYKAASNSCIPPGSEMAMSVMVEPAFVVQLHEESDKLTKLGFVSVKKPQMGSCAYRVKRFAVVK